MKSTNSEVPIPTRQTSQPEKKSGYLSRKDLFALMQKQAERIDLLEAEIIELKRRLNMNSNNSNKPPSSGGYGKDREDGKQKNTDLSLRGKTGKKRGGQIGHKGGTLLPYETPDTMEILEVSVCAGCHGSLADTPMTNLQKRQVVDIPEPTFFVHEYQGGEKRCPCCRVVTKSVFPEGITAPIQYGPNIKAHSCYLYNYQMSGYERIAEFWKEIYGLLISQTSLMKFNTEAHTGLAVMEGHIKEALRGATVAHSDETGVPVGNNLHWIHVVSTEFLTAYMIHAKRGLEAMQSMGILSFFLGVLVHDHWRSYLSYICMHVFCNAHHLRELNGVMENETATWTQLMKTLLLKGKRLRDEAVGRGENHLSERTLEEIHAEYGSIIQIGMLEYPEPIRLPGKRGRLKKSKGHNLLERLRDYESGTLEFLHDFTVPFDNNLAERDLRMIKVRTKVSGCFRSFAGAEWFCRIRGYISTIRKQGLPVYPAMKSIFEGEVLSPRF